MTAPVRIDAEAWADLRFATLARILRFADADHALIKVARIWSWQAEHYTPALPTYVVDADTIESALGEGGAAALVRARLAEETPEGFRIKGTEGRIEWLYQRRQASARGGNATRGKWQAGTEPRAGHSAPERTTDNNSRPGGLAGTEPSGRPGLGPKEGPLLLALLPDQRSQITPPAGAHAIPRVGQWSRHQAWWQFMLDAHDRLRRPTATRAAIKPGTPDLAKHPHEPMLRACELFLREAGYDEDAIDAKMRHVVLVHEAEAERLESLDFFKPATMWDVNRPDRFPRKVDTTLEEAKRGSGTGNAPPRSGPRAAGSIIGAATPRTDHPVSQGLIPIGEL